ncbi:hypothetical protein PSHT_15550 [Puccinia striiformis]|uniref:Uncharacterized protein n=1 Tax=Puccinia striiformis TaxID=27350 RepID=A0A2S4UEH5_9BASI|nr:hypothetical protein PSHT_15550 [Puccinia striiformis]
MVPRPSLIEDASRPLKRMAPREDLAEEAWNDRRARLRIDNNRILLVNTSPAVPERDPPQNPELPPMPLSCEFDDERVTFHRAFLRWFDKRHVLQKFLGLPFDQPVPTSAAPIPVQTLRRAEPSTPVISLDDIGTPQGSPQGNLLIPPRAFSSPHYLLIKRGTLFAAPATATSPAQDRQPAAGSDKGKARALSPPDDANAEGSLDSADGESPNTLVPFDSPIGEDDYFGVPYDRPPPTHASPPPPARQNTPLDPLCVLFPERPQHARRFVPAVIVNEFIRYADNVYLSALQWSGYTPADRRNRYNTFRGACDILRGAVMDAIPFTNELSNPTPPCPSPPRASMARPTSRAQTCQAA